MSTEHQPAATSRRGISTLRKILFSGAAALLVTAVATTYQIMEYYKDNSSNVDAGSTRPESPPQATRLTSAPPSPTAERSPTQNADNTLREIWSGPLGFQIEGSTAAIDFSSERPRAGTHAGFGHVWATDGWGFDEFDVHGSNGSVVALWTNPATPKPNECRNYADSSGGSKVRLTKKNAGQGLCIRAGEEGRYIWFKMIQISDSAGGIKGNAIMWQQE